MSDDNRSTPPKTAVPRPDDDQGLDRVEEADEESFPASDPPSWTPSHTGSPAPEKNEGR